MSQNFNVWNSGCLWKSERVKVWTSESLNVWKSGCLKVWMPDSLHFWKFGCLKGRRHIRLRNPTCEIPTCSDVGCWVWKADMVFKGQVSESPWLGKTEKIVQKIGISKETHTIKTHSQINSNSPTSDYRSMSWGRWPNINIYIFIYIYIYIYIFIFMFWYICWYLNIYIYTHI